MISNIQGGTPISNTVDNSSYTAVKPVSSADNTAENSDKLQTSNLNSAKNATDSVNEAEDQQDIKGKDEKGKKKLNKEDVNQITAALNKFMGSINCDLEFKYYEKVDQLSVKMVDQKTNETIKEFPPEDIMKAMIKTKEWIGLFLDKKA